MTDSAIPAAWPTGSSLQPVRLLGTGGMGSVYLARDTRLHRMVAVKLIRPDLIADPAARALFLREAQLGARLEHPGIVPVYDYGETEQGAYLVLRYQSGESLGDFLRRKGAIDPALARDLLAQLADVLAFAHGAGVVHRDLKPDNIFLDGPEDRPRPVVADFGIATRAGADHGPGERRLQFGTPWFMAPEQATGEHDLDGRADLYSLGVIGYLMLTGSVPYDGPSGAAVLAAAATARRSALAEAAPEAPRDLVAIIDRCLEPDPARRWTSAASLASALTSRGSVDRLRTPVAKPVAASPKPSRSRSASMSFAPELRFAARSLRRTPAVTVAALICLALGIGATTAIFSAVNRALLRPLPFRDPEQLLSVFRTTPHFTDGPFSPANVIDLLREAKTLDLAPVAQRTGFLERPAGSDQVLALRAGGALFPILGARPALGRLLTEADAVPGAPPAVLLSHELWRTSFGADSAIVGTPIRLDGRSQTVVGVLPAGFRLPHAGRLMRGDIWVPLIFDSTETGARRHNYVNLVGRPRAGRSTDQVNAELGSLMKGLVEAYPELEGEGIRVASMQGDARRPIRTPLLLLLASVGFVLLIAASNVASLLLARGVERNREVAIRSALGAARGDLIRKVMVEAGLLVGVGGTLGVVLAWLGVKVIGALAAARQPQLAGLSLDGSVLAFAVALAAAVAFGCGVVPAIRSARVDPQLTLRSSSPRAGGDARQLRFLRSLAAVEVALSMVLLLGAGLVIRGFSRLIDQPAGFDSARILTALVTLDPDRYADGKSLPRFLDPALDALRAQPGVVEAGALNLIPYDNWGSNFNIRYEGQPGDDPTRLPLVESRTATASLFPALGIRLLEGRLLDRNDADPNRPAAAVVNRALVVRDFDGKSPLGKRFHIGDTTFATIVGVVADIRNFGPERPPMPEVYWSYGFNESGATTLPIVVRAEGDPAALAGALRAAIRSIDPSAAISLVRPMEEIMTDSIGRPRFYVVLLGVFAGVAVILTIAGLYGLMSYLVAQRTREIGIRMALGSTPGRTRALVFAQGGRLVVAGLVVGLLLAAWLTRLLSGLLFGVSPLDPLTWLAAAAVLGLTASVAILLPARRATRVDPLIAIRTE